MGARVSMQAIDQFHGHSVNEGFRTLAGNWIKECVFDRVIAHTQILMPVEDECAFDYGEY